MMFLRVLGIVTMSACLWAAGPAANYRSPLSVGLSSDGTRLYVSDKTAGNVTRLDAATGENLGETLIGGEPHGLALSADGKILYVTQRKLNSIALIDANQETVLGRIPVGGWPVALALAKKSNRLYSCNQGHQVAPDSADVDDLLAYVGSLTAEVNPNVLKFAGAALRGKALFEGKARCTSCHPGPYFTDRRTHNVGVTSI